MIRHHAINQQTDTAANDGLFQSVLKRSVITGSFKQRQLPHATIKHVVDKTAGSNTRATGHSAYARLLCTYCQEKIPDPFPTLRSHIL
jgi:hypothetical protein